jgi:NAD(P)-dependent dehydrogenase (short-subunit alcohol dehydrogenase family)
MTTIAVVGAKRGLGAAIARTIGAEGLNIALISHNQEGVDALATNESVTARGYATSVGLLRVTQGATQ